MITKTESVIQESKSNLVLKKAETAKEIEDAMRLRFEVFNLEMSEGLQSSYATGLDMDEYDDFCDHIIVVDAAKEIVVGTYRLLLGSRSDSKMGFYSETEFDMSSFKRLEGEKLELGRACVHKEYRGSVVLNLMWSGIASYIEQYSINYIFGCGSIHTVNPIIISGIYGYLKKSYLSEERFRVIPLKGVPGFNPDVDTIAENCLLYMPPLFTAYIRLGARICGEPAFDEQFGVSDFLVMLYKEKVMSRYKKRYLDSLV